MSDFFKLINVFNKRQKVYAFLTFAAIVVAGILEVFSIGLFYPIFLTMGNQEEFMQKETVQKVFAILHITDYQSFMVTMFLLVIVAFILKNAYMVVFNIYKQRYIFHEPAEGSVYPAFPVLRVRGLRILL